MAEKAADRKRDRNEARYRAAQSLERAGRHKEAERLLTTVDQKSSRAARAAFDHAVIQIDHGNVDQGYRELEAMMRKYPASGVAAAALGRLVRRREDQGNTAAAISYLESLRSPFRGTELSERVEYAYAEELDKAHRTTAARDQYLRVADRFPYPFGALWDDALWKASLAEEKLGNVPRAIVHLERMLKEKEPSSLGGSYQRPRYAAARFRIAELYRDKIRDPARAAREFRRVWDENPTSLLRDDALWQEARVEHEMGDQSRACSTLKKLIADEADSRFAPCAPRLCPGLDAPAHRECRAYIVRDLTQ